jgi:leucyl/phenylalanyl-tRNA--protein transferase
MTVAYRIANVAEMFSEGVGSDIEASPQRLRAARETLFGESPGARARRVARVIARMATPRHMMTALTYVDVMARDRAVGAAALPDPAAALPRPDGFCGAALDISPTTMMQAYAQGLHARAPLGAASWWSPAKRMLRDLLAHETVASVERPEFDSHCDAVVARCAAAAMARDPMAALTPALKHAHARLLDRGYAHSWRLGEAEGYGVVMGGFFTLLGLAGEAAATRRGLLALEAELRRRNFRVLDATFVSAAIGADYGEATARADYLEALTHSPSCDRAVRWR